MTGKMNLIVQVSVGHILHVITIALNKMGRLINFLLIYP